MSKRSRRERTPNLPAGAYQNITTSAAPKPVAASAPVKATAKAMAVPSTKVINWQGEYSEVMNDLKRTAVIAGALIAVMIGLSFVL